MSKTDMAVEEALVVSSELLQPSRNVERPPSFSLTIFDESMRYAGYQKRLLFYKSAPENVVSLLKNSLAEALVQFYPLAARLRSGDGISTPLLELDCSSLSARFAEASTEWTLEQLGAFEPSHFCDSLCNLGSSPPSYPWKIEDPVLFVQITKFRCGGVSIGVGFSHQVADGVSFWHFMNSWIEIARIGRSTLPPPVISYDFKSLELSDEECQKSVIDDSGVEIRSTATSESFLSGLGVLPTKQYRLDKKAIEELKAEAAAGGSEIFSTYVVLCAHFWRKTSIARDFPESTTMRFLILANCRGKIQSLPKSYFGNAIVGFAARCSAGELERGGLPLAARLIHQAIQSLDESKAQRLACSNHWSTSNPGRIVVKPFGQAVSSNRHPVQECDFGFGRPAGVSFGTNDLHEGKIYLFPSSDGGVTITAVLQRDDMERLTRQDS